MAPFDRSCMSSYLRPSNRGLMLYSFRQVSRLKLKTCYSYIRGNITVQVRGIRMARHCINKLNCRWLLYLLRASLTCKNLSHLVPISSMLGSAESRRALWTWLKCTQACSKFTDFRRPIDAHKLCFSRLATLNSLLTELKYFSPDGLYRQCTLSGKKTCTLIIFLQ